MIAEVLVDIEHHTLDQCFDYLVPDALKDTIAVGQRVEVPFAHRKITGFVVGLKSQSDIESLKPIHAVRDLFPYMDDERMQLAEILSKRHIQPRIAYMNAMLPRALSMRYTTYFKVHDKQRLNELLAPYFKDTETIKRDTLDAKALRHVQHHLKTGVLSQHLTVAQTTGVKTVPVVVLKNDGPVKNASKQQAIIDTLKSQGPLEKKTLLKTAGTTDGPLRSLVEKGRVEIVSKERYREIASIIRENDKPITFNEEQEVTFDAIKKRLHTPSEHLIHGVTASGKSELYIALIKEVLKHGQQAIVLLPEIALTPKIVARFKAAIDEPIAIFHSALTPGEQYDQWRRMLTGEANVCIGARSAIFAPFQNIGLIVLDEEQSDAFVQREAPSYSAKEVARLRAKHHTAPIVYGSATPSIETYYEAKKGHMHLHTLSRRALKSTMPYIEIIDMKEEFKQGNPSIFSHALRTAMNETLARGEQVILLINRRGHANFVICRDCGKRIKCPQCEISLTYHHATGELKCHYCNHKEQAPSTCPACASKHIRYMGLGSEKVEMALQKTFPDARVYRMDRDSTTKKGAHERIIADFERDGDILVGTQMITKGLDFDNVTLAGVLSADMSLFVPDFYAESETYAMLTQIAGRSGRRDKPGRVLIQAYDTSHQVLEDVRHGDFTSFYEREIAFRKRARVEPFKKLTQILCVHRNYDIAYRKALEIKRFIKKQTTASVLGPTDARILRQNNRYRVQLLIRHDGDEAIYESLQKVHRHFSNNATLYFIHNPRII